MKQSKSASCEEDNGFFSSVSPFHHGAVGPDSSTKVKTPRSFADNRAVVSPDSVKMLPLHHSSSSPMNIDASSTTPARDNTTNTTRVWGLRGGGEEEEVSLRK